MLKRIRTILGMFFIILIVVVSIFFISRLKNGVNNEMREVLQLWNAGEYEPAYEMSKNVLVQKPVDYFLLTINGFSAYQAGISQINSQDRLAFIDESIFSLRKALIHKESYKDGRVHYVLGKAYSYKGNMYSDLAVKYLEAANDLHYDAADIPEYLGLAYAAAGDYRNSVAAFSLAFNNDAPPSDNLLLSIARSYMAMEEYNMATGYLHRCAASSPDSKSIFNARFMLAEVYRLTGEHDDAEKLYLTILEDSGENAEVRYQLGELYNLKGDTTRARAEWRIAVRQDPAHAKARARLFI